METKHDVFHRADERMRQTLHQIEGGDVIPVCPDPKNGRVFIDAHEYHWAMCAQCAFTNEADASLRYRCDVCDTEFCATPDDTVFYELDVDLEYASMPGFRGTLVITVLTPCGFPECQAMARAYAQQMA